MSELLTVEDVAAACRLHPRTVRRHIAAGNLRSVRIGRNVRVRREDLEEFIRPGSGEDGFDWAKVKPFTADDALRKLVGAFESGEPWIASDKYRALFGDDR